MWKSRSSPNKSLDIQDKLTPQLYKHVFEPKESNNTNPNWGLPRPSVRE